MEMHQIRYFLATARVLNFTRAAEECHVAQPSLTRAIKLLEDELGGDLFRRERNLTHLTELGVRMQPLLQQCFDSAVSAKAVAAQLKTGSLAPLSIALSRTIPMSLLIPHLSELVKMFDGLELKFRRGVADEVGEALRKGDADLAIAGPLGTNWDRFESWPLFTEDCGLLVSNTHPIASQNMVSLDKLRGERLLRRAFCEQVDKLDALLLAKGTVGAVEHVVASEADLAALLDANVGVAIAPRSTATAVAAATRFIALTDLELQRTVFAYAVAGRPRSPTASTLLKLLRANDWSGLSV